MTSQLSEILGETLLVSSKKETPVTEALEGAKTLLLYFSASWCGPCKQFTPLLSDAYEKIKNAGGDVVFVPFDEEQQGFDSYFEKMPWKALSCTSERVESLQEKYNIEGVPTLIAVDSETGNVLTREGTTFLVNDPEVKSFPWKDKTVSELLGDVVDPKGQVTTNAQLLESKYVGLYFSAHWCPPCRAATPKLASLYPKIRELGHDFECVFVSSDKDQSSFDDYFATMPWKALPFDRRDDASLLRKRFQISGIPTLIILERGEQGLVKVTQDGISDMNDDIEGVGFPWRPPTVLPWRDATLAKMNDGNLLIAFTNHLNDERQQLVEDIVTKVAKKKIDEWKDKGPLIMFTVSKGDASLDEQLFQFLNRVNPTSDTEPLVLVISGISGTAFFAPKDLYDDFSEKNLETFVDDVVSGKSVGIVL